MQSIIYSLNRLPKSIPIGFTGENHFRRICIDVGKWTAEYPNGVISAYVLRPNDLTALPVAVTMVETLAVWEADSWSTAQLGTAKIQWMITDGDTIVGKSPIVELDIRESLVLGEEPPEEPDPDWYEMLLQAIAEKQDTLTAGSGIRIVQNVISATGSGGTADFDELTNRPSYNGNPMTHATDIPEVPTELADLTADSTHRLVTDEEKAEWNDKQDAISDLVTIRSGAALGATAVQPEAGKGLFSGSYNDLTDKPTIPTVPTNVSAFTNDAGYLTQHQSLSAYRTAADQDEIDGAKYTKPEDGIPLSDLDPSDIDDTVTEDSTNLVTSGAVFAVVGDVESILENINDRIEATL